MTNGTVIPSAPGCSQRSPSSASPWTAIATSPASDRCSCRAANVRARDPAIRPASARPQITDAVMATSATIPAERLSSQKT